MVVDFRNACSALHTLEWTMNEFLELKMSAVEMDPKQTSEHDGLNGLSRCDFL